MIHVDTLATHQWLVNPAPVPATSHPVVPPCVYVHRYQLRVCVEACKHRLLTIDNRSISWNTALAMLHLPPGLQEGDAFAALTEVSTGCSSTRLDT
jgi:hypothetical protein